MPNPLRPTPYSILTSAPVLYYVHTTLEYLNLAIPKNYKSPGNPPYILGRWGAVCVCTYIYTRDVANYSRTRHTVNSNITLVKKPPDNWSQKIIFYSLDY